MSILEIIGNPECRLAALDFHAEQLRQAEAMERISRALHAADLQRLEELRAMSEHEKVTAFILQDRKEFVRTVNRVSAKRRIDKYWFWERWFSKVR